MDNQFPQFQILLRNTTWLVLILFCRLFKNTGWSKVHSLSFAVSDGMFDSHKVLFWLGKANGKSVLCSRCISCHSQYQMVCLKSSSCLACLALRCIEHLGTSSSSISRLLQATVSVDTTLRKSWVQVQQCQRDVRHGTRSVLNNVASTLDMIGSRSDLLAQSMVCAARTIQVISN